MKSLIINLFVLIFLCLNISCLNSVNVGVPDNVTSTSYDILVYGATPSGILAAIQGRKLGKSVLLINTSTRLGGMATNGLGNTDVGDEHSIGGLTHDFFELTSQYNSNTLNKYLFEPKIALKVFSAMILENKLDVLNDDRISLEKNGVVKEGTKITSIQLESGKVFYAKVFIDASYEGDLMKQADVSYIVGRESNSIYAETINGTSYSDKRWAISPFLVEGDNKSGLLPYITNSIGKQGSADNKVQGYCYRLTMTKNVDNRILIEKPNPYDEKLYELLIRASNFNPDNSFINVVPITSSKFDVNNQGLISLDLPSINYKYADSNYKERKNIEKNIENYIRGFIWTLQNNPRVSDKVRLRYSGLGLAKDEFLDNSNWPVQIYLREGRRMKGSYVMTERNVKNQIGIYDSIGKGSYPIDCHVVEYGVSSDGKLLVEGEFIIPIKPYQISYRSLLPKKAECSNLLVTCCLSASHVAFCSLRMEPVFMIIGQSAGVAASMAIDGQTSLHEIDYNLLKKQLLQLGQIL